MLRYMILACLCLLARADDNDETLSTSYRVRHHEIVHPNLTNYLISPDTFRGRETYVVAQYNTTKVTHSLRELEVKLSLIHVKRGEEHKHCDLQLVSNPNSRIFDLTSVRRLSENNVILTLSDLGKNDVYPTSQIIAYDINNCRVKFSYSNITKNLIVVPKDQNKFDVFYKDPKFCQGNPMCRLSYDLSINRYSDPYPFSTDPRLDWSTLRVEVLRNGYLKIHGSSIEGDRYIVFLLDPITDNMKNVMEIPFNNKKLDIASTGMSFCWINPDQKDTVHCNQLDNDGQLIFKKTITFDESRKLINVRETEEGQIFMLTNNADCKGDDCWNMFATRIKEDSIDVERKFLPFLCSGNDQTKFVVFDAKNVGDYRTDLHYGCKYLNKFNLNTVRLYR